MQNGYRFNYPDYIRLMTQSMNFLIMESFLISIWPKYSPHDPVFKYPYSIEFENLQHSLQELLNGYV